MIDLDELVAEIRALRMVREAAERASNWLGCGYQDGDNVPSNGDEIKRNLYDALQKIKMIDLDERIAGRKTV